MFELSGVSAVFAGVVVIAFVLWLVAIQAGWMVEILWAVVEFLMETK